MKRKAKTKWQEVFGSSDSDFEIVADSRDSKNAKKEASTDSDFPSAISTVLSAPEYMVELAKSGRAECKKCGEKIAKFQLRVGVIMEGDWGLLTRWQHVHCTIFDRSIRNAESLDGYIDLDIESQELLKERVFQSATEVDQDMVAVNPDELVRKDWDVAVEPSMDLLMPLLPYQKEGLGWMLHQERSRAHGGILADEMGMGKTIQAISVILSNPPAPRNAAQKAEWNRSDESHGIVPNPKQRGKSLVVVPTVAIRQWQTELLRFTKPGSLSVHVYHGGNRSTESSLHTLMKADVVLTSFKIIELEYRRATAGTKVECSICGKKYYPEKLRVHRKYFCGDTAQLTEAQSKTQRKKLKRGSTAEVSHSSESDSEEDEIDKQKRLIKEMRERGETGARAKATTKRTAVAAPSRVTGRKKPLDLQGKKVSGKGCGEAKKASKGKGPRKMKGPPNRERDTDSDYCESSEEVSDMEEEKKNRKRGGDRNGKRGRGRKPWRRLVSTESDAEDSGDSEVEAAIAEALRQSRSRAVPSLLHELSWFRIILDEAHLIKDRSTSTAKAAFNLVSLNKWCLTGTPLQNRVGELYSLVRFLRMDPFAYYYCKAKNCQCKSLHYRFTSGKCDDCAHSAMNHFCHFNKHILNPIKRTGYIGEGRRAMLTLKEKVLDEILLRRTKTTRSEDIQLPLRIVKVRMDHLDEQEEDFYQAMYTQSQAQFNTFVAAGTVLNNYAHIFDILIRLRQVVDHPYLVLHSDNYGKNSLHEDPPPQISAATDSGSEEDGDTCGFCHEPVVASRTAQCGHVFCCACVFGYLETLQGGSEDEAEVGAFDQQDAPCATCPQCAKPLSLMLSEHSHDTTENAGHTISIWDHSRRHRKSFLKKIDLKQFQSSTKMEALMQELYRMRDTDIGAKAIVFSQFVNFLDLIDYRIQLGGITCAKLVGNMSIDARDKIIRQFQDSADLSVLLVSLKAGGVALNLTAANYIFVMDPWWNPAAEMQAIDRTHRIGQHKPIFATRFIIEDTIEERILRLQEKKKLVFDGTVGGDASSMARLTVDDMRFLFQ